ncbi:MAG: PTS sugar transporter subunit IIA [Elusimicrobiota bacterium]
MNIEIIISTHGNFGRELLNSVDSIMGKTDGIEQFNVLRSQAFDKIKEDFKKLMNRKLEDGAILIMTDMVGGTPTNIALPYLKEDTVEIVTGLNLPMLIKAVSKKDKIKNVNQLARIVEEAGVKSILNCREKVDSK